MEEEVTTTVASTTTEPTPSVEPVAETTATPSEKSSDAGATATVPAFDLNQLRASLQRREAELQKDYEAREAKYKADLEAERIRAYKLETAGLDDEQKAFYDAQYALKHTQEEVESLRRQLEENNRILYAQQHAEERKRQAIDYYAMLGMPKELAEKNSESPEQLNAAAVKYFASLKQKATQAPPVAQQVTSHVPGRAAGGILSKMDKMSAEERNNVYERAKAGLLSPEEL